MKLDNVFVEAKEQAIKRADPWVWVRFGKGYR